MKLSIIIPMYNCEKYIAECLDSILNSNLDRNEYEIIVVNDGSKDNGPAIVQDYANRFENIHYYTQENQGQSVARNLGMTKAKGEYIWFVDGDDAIETNWDELLNTINSLGDIDILAFQLKEVNENGDFVKKECEQPSVPHNKILSGRDAIVAEYNPSSVCALIIKKEMMAENGLKFKPGITHQDVELSYKLFAHAKSVYFSDFAPYIYILHPGSTSKSINPQKKLKYLSDDITIIQSFRELAQSFSGSDPELAQVIHNRSNNVLWGMVYSIKQNRKQWRELGITEPLIAKLKEAGLYPMHETFDSWKKQLMAWALNHEWFLNRQTITFKL